MSFRCLVPLLLLAGPAMAQAPTYSLPISEHVYANGLRLLVWEGPGDPRVAAKIFTDMGGALEQFGTVLERR